MQVIYSDIQNFLEEASKKIELDVLKIKDIDIKDVLDMLIEAGIFKNEFSAKVFLIQESINSIYEERYSYPIDYLAPNEEIPDEEKIIEESKASLNKPYGC